MAKQPIGEFLSTLRKAKGYTQQQVADELGISNRTLSAWEQGRAYPDILSLPALAELYGVTVDEILQGERKQPQDGTQPMPEISPQSQVKLYKSKLAHAQTKNMGAVGCGIGGAVLLCICAAVNVSPFWLGVLLTVLSVGLLFTSLILLLVWHKSLQTSAGIYDDEMSEQQHRFVLMSRRNTCKSLLVLGLVWLVCGLVIGAVYCITNVIQNYTMTLNGLGRTMLFVPLFAGLAILLGSSIWWHHTVRSHGNENEKATAKRNDKRLCKCLFALIPFVFGFMVASFFLYYTFIKSTTVYSAAPDEFLHTFQTVEISQSIADGAGIQAGTYYCDMQGAFERNEYREYDDDWRAFLVIDDNLICVLSGEDCNVFCPIAWEYDGQSGIGINHVGGGKHLHDTVGNTTHIYNLSYAYRTTPYEDYELYGYLTYRSFYVHIDDTEYSLIQHDQYSYAEIGVPIGLIISLASVVTVIIIYADKREKIKFTL